MKTLSLNQMEAVKGGIDWWRWGVCSGLSLTFGAITCGLGGVAMGLACELLWEAEYGE